MADENPLDHVRGGVSVVADIMKAAGDIPEVKEAASNLGQTAVTVTKTINNILLPIAAVNFAFDKARKYFAEKFQGDLEATTARIPIENIVEPKASIAGPTLQGLAFSHEENNLKAMYLNLLATAMDGRAASKAHPAFVEIIKQLTSEEAKLISQILKTKQMIPIAQIRSESVDHGYTVLHQHLLHARHSETGEPQVDPTHAAMVDNWIRLGLVEVVYDQWITREGAYEWIEGRPEFKECQEKYQREGAKISFTRGTLGPTKLGAQFAESVGLLD